MKSVVTILAIFLIRCAYLRAEPEPSMMDMSVKIMGSDSCIFGVKSISFFMSNRSFTARNISTEESCQSMGMSKQAVIMIHGFQSTGNASIFQELAKSFVKKGYTVFAIDWSQAACTNEMPIVKFAEYSSAVNNTREIGKRTANFVVDSLMKKCEISLKNITFIGHSLGAHVAGFAAKSINDSTGEKVSRIIAADPARPMFMDNNCTERLCKTDAECVTVVHTTSSLGIPKPMGHRDLYCNNGDAISQPGCMAVNVACAHTKSVEYISKMISGCGFFGAPMERQLKMFERKPTYPNSSTTDCIFINQNILDENCSKITGSYYVFVEKDPFCTQNIFNCKQ